ncbi:MAG: glycosyltransferase family 4 protein [Thermofilaceae archaeon]
MRILILSHEYPPYTFGGVAHYTAELAEYLASRGLTVYVVAGRSSKQYLDFEFRKGIKVIRVKFPDVPIRSLWYSCASKNIVQKLAAQVEYTVFNAGSAGLLPIWLYKKVNNLISIIHGTTFSLISYFKYGKISEKLRYINLYDVSYYVSFLFVNMLLNERELKASNSIVAVARHIIDELTQIYPDLSEEIRSKSHIVYGGIDYEHLSSIYRLYRNPVQNNGKIVYAYIGRLYLTKGAHYALKAFKLIQDELGKEAELWIFGKGPLEKQLMFYAKKNNINAKFLGFIAREKLLKLLAKHVSTLLFPSLYEGCPYALLEANALGIPVIAWDMPWSREFIIQGVNGYLAKPFSLEDLADYAVKTLSLNNERIQKLGLKYDKRNTFSKLKCLIVGG